MHIEAAIDRVRAFAAAEGWSCHRLAKAAGLSWQTVANMQSQDWSPSYKTLRKLESLIPPDFQPGHTPEGAADAALSE